MMMGMMGMMGMGMGIMMGIWVYVVGRRWEAVSWGVSEGVSE